ncbi:HYD1 signature containing ADP-ribosyltransferase family protein, partial [Streptomyces avicenniae]|uniref:HYD1 signature containing ADP-ribosyltransferase family protein n=1 Tax=Streptomyces avicenniae TaxID=500153 RepID=UPI00069B6B23
ERASAPPPDEEAVRAATRDRQAADEAQAAAQGRVDEARGNLDAARELAAQAREMREEAAREAARDIDEASDAGIQNRSWWQNLVRWFTDAWDTIVAICKVIVAVLGIIALIIGGPLALIVLAAAVVVLADTLGKFARGEASLLDVMFAALDCIPGMRGLTTLGGLVRGIRSLVTTGLRGITQGLRGLGQTIRRLSRGGDDLICRTDPVDMATGEMVMDATDVELPGVLPLILVRHHRSGMRQGRWFGPSWTSTLDQRLILDDGGARLVTEEGRVLDYPRPLPGEPVLPVEGPRWPLEWDGDPATPLTVHRLDTGRLLRFAPVPGRRGGELPLVALADRNGNTIRVRHDAHGAPTDLTDDCGHHVGVTTDGRRVTALHLLSAPGRPLLVRYDHDAAGNLAAITNSSGAPLTLTYDDHHRLTSWHDRNDNTYRYTYDDSGRCTATSGPDGILSSRIAYDPAAHRTLFTDALGHTTTYQFDDCYQLHAETDPLGHTTHRTWDRHDRLLTHTDPLGHTTTYTYDAHGTPTSVTRPDGHRVTLRTDARGLPVEFTEADGTVWRRAYDEHGNRTETTGPLGERTTYRYDGRGALLAVTDAAGAETTVRCDAAGLPVEVTGPLGAVTRFRRDAFGRPVEITDPLGAVTRLTWTPEGLLSRRESPLGAAQTWEWDGEGNCVAHTDETGRTTRFTYGPFDLIKALTEPEGARWEFEHDAETRLTRVRGPHGLTWDYAYDQAGHPLSQTDWDGRRVTYETDAAGRLAARVNATGQRVTYGRDGLGRVVSKDCDGATVTYAYDPAGRLLAAEGADSTLARAYDPLGHLLTETVDGLRSTHTSDRLGRPLTRTTPSGHTSAWTYDAAGRPARLDTAGRVVTFAHDAAGRETRRHLPSSATLARDLDLAGAPTGLELTGPGASRWRREQEYRPDQLLTALRDSRGDTASYTLDPAGHVTAVTGPDRAEGYQYGTADRLLSATRSAPGGTGTEWRPVTLHGTRVKRAGAVHYTYDAAGRVVRRRRKRLSGPDETWTYTWDAEDRLTAVTTPDGTSWRYAYDALGRRTAKRRMAQDGSVAEETRFTWDATTLVEQTTTTGAAPATLTWDHLGDSPLAQTERAGADDTDGRFLAIVTDLVGAPVELLDAAGGSVWRARRTLWGAPYDGAERPPVPLRFPGQYADEETGWFHNVHRHYDPDIAAYTSPDPLGLSAAPDCYGYVPNPTAWTDPLGLVACNVRALTNLRSLYHYTNEIGLRGILESRSMRPSLLSLNPRDARYGNGQYLTDILPGSRTLGQLSYAFLRIPYAGRRFTHFVEIDVQNLRVLQSIERPDVFVIPNEDTLDLVDRIIRSGRST